MTVSKYPTRTEAKTGGSGNPEDVNMYPTAPYANPITNSISSP